MVTNVDLAAVEVQWFDNFADAESIWQRYSDFCQGYVFQQYHWLALWYSRIGQFEGYQPLLVAVADDGQPLMFLPLALRKTGPVILLQWLGGEMNDYAAPMLADQPQWWRPEVFPRLWQFVRNQLPRHDAVRFTKQPERVQLQTNPFDQLPRQHFDGAYSAQLPKDWQAFYESKIKKRIRADSRRQRKRLAELGAVNFQIAEEPLERRQITETMIRHKRRRYGETGALDLLADARYRDFYLSAVTELPADQLHICCLTVGDTVVATHWGLVAGKRFYFLMPTYEGGDWRRYSVGRILLEELLAWAIANDYQVFDFLRGIEDYKTEWCDTYMDLGEHLQGVTLRGGIYVALHQLKRVLFRSKWVYIRTMRLRSWLLSRRAARR